VTVDSPTRPSRSAAVAPYTTVALDVGGVIYFDEPFELAWIQLVYEHAHAEDPSYGLPDLLRDMETFYLNPDVRAAAGTPFSSPTIGGPCWAKIRRQWTTLVQPIPGAAHAVRTLARTWEICVVANQPSECQQAFDALGIADAFALVALDSTVGYAKPDTRLLAWAVSQLGRVPQDVLVVGNRVDHDIAPALRLGCDAALVRPARGWIPPPHTLPAILQRYTTLRTRPAAGHEESSGLRFRCADLGELAEILMSPANCDASRPPRPHEDRLDLE